MLSLSDILENVYKELSLWETIDRNSGTNNFLKKKYSEVWKIETEVKIYDFLEEISLLIAFDYHFPLSIPHIYLSQESYDKVKYIPHVDENHFICTFHTDAIILDKNNPVGIVCNCLERAKYIIQQGLGEN